MSARSATSPVIGVLVRQLEQAFDVRSWHGTNLLGSLRGLDGRTLAWRPQPGRHNIAEIAVHAAYWKYRVHRLLSDDGPRSFELPGSDFFEREGVPSAAAWQEDVQLLRSWQARLLGAVRALDPGRLDERARGGKFTLAELVNGAAAHDLYHAGQIQLIKRLHQQRVTRGGGR